MLEAGSDIGSRIRSLHRQLDPRGVQLVAVSKFHPVEALRQAYDAGQRLFGENRVQELAEKMGQMPPDVQWHMIGHLQTNKVGPLIGRVAMIESVDTERLLRRIDQLSERAGVVTRVLMEVHVAAEEAKSGWTPDQLVAWMKAGGLESLRATHVCGLMAMATNTPDADRVAADFRAAADTRRRVLQALPGIRDFDILSMGMSGDYPLAIDAGATHVRIGTDIFGPRESA